MVPIRGVDSDHRCSQDSLLERALDLESVFLLAPCHEMNAAAADGSFELVAVELAAELWAVLLKLQAHIARRTEKVLSDDPAATERGRLRKRRETSGSKQTGQNDCTVHA